jgi:hypothetical protein
MVSIGRKQGDAAMNFRDVRDVAMEFGAKAPRFDHTNPVAGCWIDRVELLPMAARRGETELSEAIDEADRYAGR